MQKINVLFVCLGNICRSPTAEGVFTKLLADQNLLQYFRIDSAGTHAYHVGAQADSRSQKAASARGFDLSMLRARKVTASDFEIFDYILAMDEDNLAILTQICPAEHQEKVRLFLTYEPNLGVREVPDPYYGGQYGFEKVLDLTEAASRAFLKAVRAKHNI